MFRCIRPLPLAASLCVALAITACATQSLRPGQTIPQPTDYRSWHHVKSMVIEPGHALHDAFGGIHHVYANDKARAGLTSGQYEDGAVFAFDLLATNTGGNAIQEGDRKVLGIMHKSSAAFANTGGWGFAGFGPDGKNVVKDMQQQCFQCHEGQQSRGYVFSQWRP